LKKTFTVLLSISLLCGCGTIRSFFASDETVDPSDQYVVYTDGKPRVRIGVGIVVHVGAVAQPPTIMTVQVDQNGEITLPYLLKKPVLCNDLTLDELRDKLVNEYKAYIKQPQVTVTFAPFDGRGVSPWGTVMVLGQVGRPGPVNLTQTMELTVTKALQEAGGMRPYANQRKIKVTSFDKAGNKTCRIVDVLEIGEDGDMTKDIRLKAGDVVWVPESIW
jgi:polysaccharide export outer membrane protein